MLLIVDFLDGTKCVKEISNDLSRDEIVDAAAYTTIFANNYYECDSDEEIFDSEEGSGSYTITFYEDESKKTEIFAVEFYLRDNIVYLE